MRIPLFSSIFLITLFQIWFGVNILWVSGKCLADQKSLLLQLKNTVQLKNYSLSTKLVLWNQSADCCSKWGGVKCDKSGRVTDLDLSSETISDGINGSSTLFKLQFLQSVNLANNGFNFTQIPTEFKNLASLTNLNLSNSGFGGQIPIELSQLTSLVNLDLSTLFPENLSLKLENPNLTMFVQNLKQLTQLHLDGVKISAPGYDWGQAISSWLPNLSVLSLTNCNISGPFDSSLSQLQFLSVIRLGQNNLNAPVPEFIADFKNLTGLSLSSCNLTGVFPQKIFGVQTLKNLDLSNNRLLHGSLPDFPQNGSLQNLVLTTTNFSGALPDSIGNLGNLSKMDLASANFTGQIPKSMGKLTQLAYLDFSSNMFTGAVPSLQMSKNLTHIDLSHNNLSGPFSSIQFEGLVNLAYIDLRFNSFTGTIPSSLFGLPSLKKFQLSNNHFDGSLAEIPNASSSMLDTLELSGNKLGGEIPPSFFDLKRLNILSLSSNNLNGTIQLETVQKLVNLTSLDLSYNNLSIETGGNNSGLHSFPQITTLKLASCKLRNFPDLKNQTKMFYLDLSENQIGGEIPNWIWKVGNGSLMYLNLSRNFLENLQEPYVIPSLSVLDLHSNNLRGELPKPPQTATYVDYSSNFFNSSIPVDIGNNLAFVYLFSIANNNLTGTIPISICNASYLQVLDMSNNSLSGFIPLCLIEGSETLGVLNLGKNRLSGNISGMFSENCGLETLDLHDNQLEGKIPESLANCTSLEVLNLGNNQINDMFPCFLNNSTNLRVLVLRSNMFHGGIQCPGVSKSWPNLQIIDIASNNFSGALIPQCFVKWKAMIDDPESEVKHLHFKFLQLNNFYYQDTVTVRNKGLEMELVKILTVFTAIDFSMNRFEGNIPETIGELKALYVLNLSRNALAGSIPSSLGNLKQLGSLDLSVNKLRGTIPTQLASLTFLAFLNLSHNQLTGTIPSGTQFQTFNETSFEGNNGLCGSPLNISCSGSESLPLPSPTSQRKPPGFDWQFIFTGLGFGFGAGLVLAPLMFWKQGRHWWDEQTDKVVIMILPTFGLIYPRCDHSKVEAEENIEEKAQKDAGEFDDDDDDDEEEDEFEERGGRYCVFCSKLDIFRKQAIHNPKCSCHNSTPKASYFSSTFSSYSS
ncbi:hypothetical protein LguiA_016414 [Lonicera macranthoides]